MKADREDYIRRLIAGIRKEIEEDPDTIRAKAESGEVTIWRWVDVELLCLVIEKEILDTVNEIKMSMNTEELKILRMHLKQGNYDGVDIMHAWIAVDELLDLRVWQEKAFLAHPNIDLDIETLDR